MKNSQAFNVCLLVVGLILAGCATPTRTTTPEPTSLLQIKIENTGHDSVAVELMEILEKAGYRLQSHVKNDSETGKEVRIFDATAPDVLEETRIKWAMKSVENDVIVSALVEQILYPNTANEERTYPDYGQEYLQAERILEELEARILLQQNKNPQVTIFNVDRAMVIDQILLAEKKMGHQVESRTTFNDGQAISIEEPTVLYSEFTPRAAVDESYRVKYHIKEASDRVVVIASAERETGADPAAELNATRQEEQMLQIQILLNRVKKELSRQ